MREYETGATRDDEGDKLDYEGFLSPFVLKRFAEYMHEHRKQADGKLRDSDNWQKGIPVDDYMSSMWRHFMDVWALHRGGEAEVDLQTALCSVLFNVQGYLHELVTYKVIPMSDLVEVQPVRYAQRGWHVHHHEGWALEAWAVPHHVDKLLAHDGFPEHTHSEPELIDYNKAHYEEWLAEHNVSYGDPGRVDSNTKPVHDPNYIDPW